MRIASFKMWRNLTTIALIGDSLTTGTYPQILRSENNEFLFRTFAKGGTTVLKRGEMSFWTYPIYKYSIAFKPDIIVVTFGLNALRQKNKELIDTHFVSDFVQLIRSYNSKHSVICTPLPITNNKWKLQ